MRKKLVKGIEPKMVTFFVVMERQSPTGTQYTSRLSTITNVNEKTLHEFFSKWIDKKLLEWGGEGVIKDCNIIR